MAALSKTLVQRFARLVRSAPTTASSAAFGGGGGDGDGSGLFRRFIQKRPIYQPALPPDHIPGLPSGNQLSDRIKSLNQTRIRLDCLSPPPRNPQSEPDDDEKEIKITVAEARKVLRASQMEAVRARLRSVQSSSVPYAEFVQICNEAAGESETGSQIARSLDQSGSVIVLGDIVFLRPELVR